eukprot:4312147-Alexandrium_andersonii.AAC.1
MSAPSAGVVGVESAATSEGQAPLQERPGSKRKHRGAGQSEEVADEGADEVEESYPEQRVGDFDWLPSQL